MVDIETEVDIEEEAAVVTDKADAVAVLQASNLGNCGS
jgi:hypothetical protein